MRPSAWLLAALALLAPSRATADPTPEFQRGVCFAHTVHPTRGYGSAACAKSLRRLQELGVNWISVTPFGFAPDDHTPEVRMIGNAPPGYRLVGETDERVAAVVQQAHALGIKVMLKPHLWINPRGGSWRGSIHFDDPADWDAWFAEYTSFMLHYARLARDAGADALCVGTELVTATRERPGAWRTLIASVRDVYAGPLTYAAHFDDEAQRIPFWDALDYIGINAYFPLTAEDTPTTDALVAAWRPLEEALRAFAAKWNRPILFTEIGYRSTADAARRPNLWHSDAPYSPMTQARAYDAVYRVFADEPWFRGVFWWKWESDDDGTGGLDDTGFTPQHKPAEFVLRTANERLAGEIPTGAGAD